MALAKKKFNSKFSVNNLRLLCDNEFEGSVPLELQNRSSLYELQFDDDLVFLWDAEIGSVYRNFGHWYELSVVIFSPQITFLCTCLMYVAWSNPKIFNLKVEFQLVQCS